MKRPTDKPVLGTVAVLIALMSIAMIAVGARASGPTIVDAGILDLVLHEEGDQFVYRPIVGSSLAEALADEECNVIESGDDVVHLGASPGAVVGMNDHALGVYSHDDDIEPTADFGPTCSQIEHPDEKLTISIDGTELEDKFLDSGQIAVDFEGPTQLVVELWLDGEPIDQLTLDCVGIAVPGSDCEALGLGPAGLLVIPKADPPRVFDAVTISAEPLPSASEAAVLNPTLSVIDITPDFDTWFNVVETSDRIEGEIDCGEGVEVGSQSSEDEINGEFYRIANRADETGLGDECTSKPYEAGVSAGPEDPEQGAQGRVHGSGHWDRDTSDKYDKIDFSFDAKHYKGGLKGKLKLNDKGLDLKIDAKIITSLSIGGTVDCDGVSLSGNGAFSFRAVGSIETDGVTLEDVEFSACGTDNGKNNEPPVDILHVECSAGCVYSSGERVEDDEIDGGNIHLHEASGAGDPGSVLSFSPTAGDANQVWASYVATIRSKAYTPSGQATKILRYDQLDGRGFRDMPWCAVESADVLPPQWGDGLVGPAAEAREQTLDYVADADRDGEEYPLNPAEGETWCLVHSETVTIDGWQLISIFHVYGEGDPNFQ